MIRNLEEFNRQHQDRVCFVVGAGTSIHFQNLEPLRDHITIAVNSGYVAVPWADFFVSDDWAVAHWSYFFKDLSRSKTTVLLYENKLSNSVGLFGDRSVVFRHRKGIHIADKYDHFDKTNHIGETRTSVGTAIMIAHIMGCSKVVLLGIDGYRLLGQRYFWQLSHHLSDARTEPYVKPYRNDKPRWDNYRKVKVKGQITDSDLMDINRSWVDFAEHVNRKVKVYNASEKSSLKVFPKINLEIFLDSL
jgi:hypothetical protein